MIDIGGAGARLRCDLPLGVGQRLVVCIRGLDADREYRIAAIVTWRESGDMGVRFLGTFLKVRRTEAARRDGESTVVIRSPAAGSRSSEHRAAA